MQRALRYAEGAASVRREKQHSGVSDSAPFSKRPRSISDESLGAVVGGQAADRRKCRQGAARPVDLKSRDRTAAAVGHIEVAGIAVADN